MAATVWVQRFSPEPTEEPISIAMPVDAVIVHVERQGEYLAMWFTVPLPVVATTDRRFVIAMTGQQVPVGARHRGAALFADGRYVAHLWETP